MDLADADTLQAFYLAQTSTHTRFVQLSAGRALMRGESLNLGKIRLLRVSAEGHHFWEDQMSPAEWRFAVLTKAQGTAKIGGIDLTPALGCLLRPGDQSDLLLDGTYNTLEITFVASLAEELGWDCAPGQLAVLDDTAIRALRETTGAAFEVFGPNSTDRPTFRTESRADRWVSLILDQLERVLRPWLQPEKAHARLSQKAGADVLRRARLALDDLDYAKRADAEQFSRDLGVSRRTLFSAFQKGLGIGPRRFNELVRLNQLRARLFQSNVDDVTITSCANDLGFSELGRMAVAYRKLFGESPRDTLRRPS